INALINPSEANMSRRWHPLDPCGIMTISKTELNRYEKACFIPAGCSKRPFSKAAASETPKRTYVCTLRH
ncbi:MAG TPA: hypothetical protein VF127_07030, partial [Nitrospira sp.]